MHFQWDSGFQLSFLVTCAPPTQFEVSNSVHIKTAPKTKLEVFGILPATQLNRATTKWLNTRISSRISYIFYIHIAVNFRKVVRRAFRNLAAKTCIRFIPKRTTDKYYIHFKQGKG